ncbi:MAG: hypothetical protein IKU69_04830 [Roseburia sp.]|nr:hypothetical protein [Roseburia sp.]
MSITPLGLNAMIGRTNDIGIIKQNEENKPAVEQQNIQTQQVKQEHDLSHKVARPEKKENEGYRYDAKEKGNGSYQGQGHKRKKGQDEPAEEGKVIVKGQPGRFDIKI